MALPTPRSLLESLIAAKLKFAPVKKNKKANYGMYATLDAILEAVEPALLTEGLLLSHLIENGILVTSLLHTGGERLDSAMKLPEITDPQKLGSAITYYRRYSICCLLSICADDDDDAQVTKPAIPAIAPLRDKLRSLTKNYNPHQRHDLILELDQGEPADWGVTEYTAAIKYLESREKN